MLIYITVLKQSCIYLVVTLGQQTSKNLWAPSAHWMKAPLERQHLLGGFRILKKNYHKDHRQHI